MNKYKILSVTDDDNMLFHRDVVVKGPRGQRKLSLSRYVVRDAKIGDVIREYKDKSDLMTLAWSCNNRMEICRIPNSDYRFKIFAKEHLTWHEKMRMGIGMRRALRKRGIRPTGFFENNMRLLVSEWVRVR